MRDEWKSNAPEDEQGMPLDYPGNPEEAVRLIREAAGREWGTWELTRHEVDVEFGPLAIAIEDTGAYGTFLVVALVLVGECEGAISVPDWRDHIDGLLSDLEDVHQPARYVALRRLGLGDTLEGRTGSRGLVGRGRKGVSYGARIAMRLVAGSDFAFVFSINNCRSTVSTV